MAEMISLLIMIVLVGVSLTAFFAVLKVFFADRITNTVAILEDRPGRSFLVGLVNFIFFSAIALGFFALANASGVQALALLGLIALLPLALGLIFGLAAVSDVVSQRLAPESAGVLRTAWGALPLMLACALPFVGWSILLPYVSLLGLGAFVSSLLRREQPPLDMKIKAATE